MLVKQNKSRLIRLFFAETEGDRKEVMRRCRLRGVSVAYSEINRAISCSQRTLLLRNTKYASKISDLELEVLKKIASDEYQTNPLTKDIRYCRIWTPAVTKREQGALGSLTKKGFIDSNNKKGSESMCWITQDGAKILGLI